MDDFQLPLSTQLVLYSSVSQCEVCGRSFQSSGTVTTKPGMPQCTVYMAKACNPCTVLMVQDFLQQGPEPDPESLCDDCNTSFKSRKGLMQHIGKVHHQSRKAATCPECKKKFKHKYAVKFHVKQVHTKATRVSCDDCGKEFYNKYILKAHCETRHSVVQSG